MSKELRDILEEFVESVLSEGKWDYELMKDQAISQINEHIEKQVDMRLKDVIEAMIRQSKQ